MKFPTLLTILLLLTACQAVDFKPGEDSTPTDNTPAAPVERDLDQSWAPHAADLEAYWQVTGNVGDLFADQATLTLKDGPSAVINGATAAVIDAPHNKGIAMNSTWIELNGTHEDMGNGNNLDFSFQSWVKYDGTGNWGRIVSNGMHNYINGWGIQVSPSLGCGTDFTGKFLVGLGTHAPHDPLDGVFITTNSAYNDNQWHHLVVTFDQSTATKILTVYVDGVKVPITKFPVFDGGCAPLGNACGTIVNDTLDYSACPAATSGTAWGKTYLGHGRWGMYDSFNGSLSEIAIWNSVLSGADVNTIYQRQR